jgi:hypothetical protein
MSSLINKSPATAIIYENGGKKKKTGKNEEGDGGTTFLNF